MSQKHHGFPTNMFATAATGSFAMVLLISAVFSTADSPCINGLHSHDKVVIDTSQSKVLQTSEGQPLICNRDNRQISWLTWFFQRSENIDFHYLDLLELLSRDKNDVAQ